MVVSVVMPVYNGARFLPQALAGLRAQQLTDFEVIVIDDGSTDDSPALLRDAARDDPRLTVIRQTHRGQTAALNEALRRARGEFLARHDADDYSLPDRLARQVAFLQAHPLAAAVGTGAHVIDEQDRPLGQLTVQCGPDAVRRGLWRVTSTLVHGSVMMRKTMVDRVGGYREGFVLTQDFDLWLRLSERHPLDNLTEPLYHWRMHAGGVYASRRARQLQYGGLGLAFAHERRRFGNDSYALLRQCPDLDEFAAQYRLRGLLHGIWGELWLRGLRDVELARPHLWQAVRAGQCRPKTLGLLAMSVMGVRWPGSAPLATSAS